MNEIFLLLFCDYVNTGSMAMQETEPSLEDMILAHNVTGQIQDAAAGYEIMSQDRTLDPQYLQVRNLNFKLLLITHPRRIIIYIF